MQDTKKIPDELKLQMLEQYKQKNRNWYGITLVIIMILQLAFMDFVLWKVASGSWELETVVISIFITGIFGTIAGFVSIIVKFFFK